MLSFTDQQIADEAERLGLVDADQRVPSNVRRKVAASLAAAARARRPKPVVPVAQSITVQPGTGVEIDGQPFPWIVQAEGIEVTLAPDGAGLVRLTIPAKSVQIKPRESEQR